MITYILYNSLESKTRNHKYQNMPCTDTTLTTCSELRHSSWCDSVRRVACPQLSEIVATPAVDAAAGQQGTGVVESDDEGNDSWEVATSEVL